MKNEVIELIEKKLNQNKAILIEYNKKKDIYYISDVKQVEKIELH
jgi:tRNA(Ser,Leu) C12 N-acetylase TAN1